MNFLWGRGILILLRGSLVLLLVSFLIDPVHSLMLSSEPLESIGGLGLLVGGRDGSIAMAQANREAPGSDWFGRSEHWAFAQYWDACQSSASGPDGTLIFGPVTFFSQREGSKTEELSFSISDATGPFLLRLSKGRQCGVKRATSGWVKLNGGQVFGPSDFRQNRQKGVELSRQVTLLSGENLLEVRLRGASGCSITLEIFRLGGRACPLLGPHLFKRGKGRPSEETLVFELDSQFLGPFSLHLINGMADGTHRVDSARIRLNGRFIIEPHDFNEHVRELSRVVSLRSRNRLSVELRGEPGDFLTLEILGFDHTPPVVTITNPSEGELFDRGPIAVSGAVDDAFSSVTVNGISAQVGRGGSFTVEGVTLAEGENLIQVIAEDSCGNQGEAQVLVYLRVGSQGPYLLFCAEPVLGGPFDTPEPGCSRQRYENSVGAVTGLTDETAVLVTVDGVVFPEGVWISHQGRISEGIWEGNFFWAFVDIPQVDGSHPFRAVVTDAEGRQSEVTVYFIRDTVPPSLNVILPTEGLVTSNPEITVMGTVDDPGALVRLGWDGPEIPVVNGMFATTERLVREGSNEVTLSATDGAGNSRYVTRRVILDTQPPQITLTYPAEQQAVNTPALTVAGSIMEQNIDQVSVSVNGGQVQALTVTGTDFSGVATLSPGQNTLTLHAVDKAGNTTTVTRSVLLDVEVPGVTITAPLSGVLVSGVMNITVEASDGASGIASVTLYVGGQAQITLNQPPFHFTLDTSLLSSGLHPLTLKATDRAGNEAEATLEVTVDNEAPLVAITDPVSGAFVSGWITASVQASDAISGVASVSLYVDGLLQATLAQPPFNFPLNTLLFGSGNHDLTARAIDNSGNQAETSILVVFDDVPPTVSITSPGSGAVVSGTITVTVEASDSISGVANVTLYIDNQPHSTLTQPPYSFSVDTLGLASGFHTLRARAIDRVGNRAEASLQISVIELLRVEITSPANGATVNKSSTVVQGRIYNQTGEIGVVVNGLLAEVQGGDFAAIVPLQVGQNILTATATWPDGTESQAQVTIYTETQEEFVRLSAIPTSGVLDQAGVLKVTFEAEAYLPNPVFSYSWDFNGDGIPEMSGTEATVMASYPSPGIYFPRVRVTDSQGNSYSETTVVHVLSREEMDALLRSKWEGMKAKLLSGDIEGALVFFSEFTKQDYRELFNALSSWLPAIVQEMSDIQLIRCAGNAVIYDIRTVRNGIEYSFQLLFTQDAYGLWRITSF